MEKSYYLVAEKILTGDEKLPEDWPIHGTTGYNFSNLVNGLFVDPANERKLDRIYRAFIGRHANFEEIVYECKKLVMDQSSEQRIECAGESSQPNRAGRSTHL